MVAISHGNAFSRSIRLCAVGVFASFIILYANSAHATEGGIGAYVPGFRDFMTGYIPDQGGLYYRHDFYFYGAEVSRTVKEGAVQADVDMFVFTKLMTPTFVLPGKILGAKYAMSFSFALTYAKFEADVTTTMGTVNREESATGIGDFILNILCWVGTRGTSM